MGLRRSLKLFGTLGSTAVQAGVDQLKAKIQGSSKEPLTPLAAVRLVEGLDQLKGAAMKLGQMLSIMEDLNIVPPEWMPILAKLQNEATPQPWSVMEPLLVDAGVSLDLFESIDPQAIHAASIGQVHKAILKDGTPIALKIRYPNLEESVRSDISLMTRAIKLMKVLPNSEGIDDVAAMVEEVFLQELNFAKEKEYYQHYHRLLNGKGNLIVPEVIEECCTPSTLATRWQEGVPIFQWIAEHQDQWSTPEIQQVRNRLTQTLEELVFKELFEVQCIQSDPNPANFLVSPDHQIVLLDFGATQTLPEHVVQNYHDLCVCFLSNDTEAMRDVCLRAKFLLESDSQEAQTAFVELMSLIAEPFQTDTYSWSHCQLMKRLNEAGLRFSIAVKFRPPPSEIVFLNRRIIGNQLILERLGGEFGAKQSLQSHLNL